MLFSCHYDTVPGMGQRRLIVEDGIVRNDGGEPLGADDTNGVWVLRQLIQQGFPATYIFHADEELGALGAMWVAAQNRAWLEQFYCAIAIDRRGYGDVITHMRGKRVCDDTFAWYLADILEMKPCPYGGMTDTYMYRQIIPQCTNISCGYFKEHSEQEWSNFTFCQSLVERLLRLKPERLVKVARTELL